MSNRPVEEQRQQLLEDACKIEEYIQPLPPPRTSPALVVLSGLPGSGKSYFCRRLASRYPLARLESDALRKALFGQPTHSADESRRLFSACHLVLSRLLSRGIAAIFDATNLREMHRRQVYHIADEHKAKLILVHLQASPAVVHERLEARARGPRSQDLSDAGPEVYERMQHDVEPIGRPHISVDTSADIEPAIAAILQQIEQP
jgi:predicted kinase